MKGNRPSGLRYLGSLPSKRRSAQAKRGRLGGLLRAPEAEPLSVLSTCVTKQTKDMRYSEVEPRWFLGFGLTHDDAVCPGKRVVSWINACSSCRATKRRRCHLRCVLPPTARLGALHWRRCNRAARSQQVRKRRCSYGNGPLR